MVSKKSEVKKIQFSFTEEALEAIDKLANTTGAATKTEVIRNALKVYNWIVDMQEEGLIIKATDDIKYGRVIELMDQRFPTSKPNRQKEIENGNNSENIVRTD